MRVFSTFKQKLKNLAFNVENYCVEHSPNAQQMTIEQEDLLDLI